MSSTVIEFVRYKLKTGATMAQLEDTHSAVNAFLQAQDGFYYRSLSEDKDGMLIDLCYWRDMAAAKAASEAFMSSKACHQFMGLCDAESVVMQHMTALTEAMNETCAEEA